MRKQIVARLSSMKKNTVAVGAGLMLAAGQASAAISTEEITEAVTAAGAAIAAVGAAVLIMHVGGKVYKWIKGAI